MFANTACGDGKQKGARTEARERERESPNLGWLTTVNNSRAFKKQNERPQHS